MRKRLLAGMLSAALAAGMLAGCAKEQVKESSAEETETSVSSEESTDGSEEDGSSSSAAETTEAFTPDFSKYLDENGFIEGVTAGDFVNIPDFSTWVFNRADVAPSDEEADSYVDLVLKKNLYQEITEGEIEDGDQVVMDYEGTFNGEVFESQTNQTLEAGSAAFVDDFLTKIIGHKVGETFTLDITFPDPYENNTDLSGQTTQFTVTVHSIQRAGEKTDAYIAANASRLSDIFSDTDFTTVQELKDYITDLYIKTNLPTAISEKLGEEVTCEDYPENAIQFSLNSLENYLQGNYGMSADDYFAMYNLGEDEINAQYQNDAKQNLLYQAIAEREGFAATDEEIMQRFGVEDEAALEQITSYYGRPYVAFRCLQEMSMEYITSLVTVE